MTKFFVQLLFSVLVGVSAALSFSPNGKAMLHKTLQEANVSMRDTAGVTLKSFSDVAAKVITTLSVKANAKASIESDEKAEINVKSNLNAKISNKDSLFDILLPDFRLNNSFTHESRTNSDADVSGLDTELKDKTKSTFESQTKAEADILDLDLEVKDKTESALNLALESGK
jgi:hypothetical protein